ncbi:hypothetical protein J5U18_01010 [Sphingobacteriaceae bacterium WQ 2009]|uniref:Uncharacterized protein n=1 Tax=Rhinopithecimicrobium faecis TaxID=2820698 RepID=A0A8T4H793_9SPHI|nr:hypothetical protein [Sphingobacteriaceae bacterium WQ 2009]
MELFIDKNAIRVKENISIIGIIITGIIVSCYFFPFGTNFTPKALNSKIILAVFGVLLTFYNSLIKRSFVFNKALINPTIFALVFSAVGFISVDINNSVDYSYASYIVSFATWLFAAYATIQVIKATHKKVNFQLLFNYLAAICVIQCIIALTIDNYLPFKTLIDTYISQDTVASVEFLNKVERLYGIGAALDPAGTRFSVVLIGLTALLIKESRKSDYSNKTIILYWIAFGIISVVGNMISRTTTVGMSMGLLYLIYDSQIIRTNIAKKSINLWKNIFIVTFILVVISTYFYQTNEDIRQLFKFAFEGFFNWIEDGEWKTSSTDKLNSTMWIWPTDLKTWIIGKADFSFKGTLTDIGYCRFIFYNGIIGLVIFSLFFIYNGLYFYSLNKSLRLFFLALIALGFIIWIKIPTDLFLIYALLYNINPKEL